MILGTASHVGKSIITAGLGRVFADDGYRVVPFKAQNMSLNSAATPDGGEIGRAQALQAEACRVAPSIDMNPILLKPSTDTGAQVVLLGKIWGQVTASDYHTRRVEQLFPEVLGAYRRLAGKYELVLLEGAGSPAEINLREHDIVNMRMAHAADAACLLVGDIDRGGVFASLLGTMELLEPDDRARIRGFMINKFRGDESLLRPGVAMIETRLGVPCLGVVPFLHDLGLDEEDGVALEDRASAARRWRNLESGSARALRIGVIALRTWPISPTSTLWHWSLRSRSHSSKRPKKWPRLIYSFYPAPSRHLTIYAGLSSAVLPKSFGGSLKPVSRSSASAAAFRCLEFPSMILRVSRIRTSPVAERRSVFCRCEPYCAPKKPCGVCTAAYDKIFSVVAHPSKLHLKATRSTSVKRSTKPERFR